MSERTSQPISIPARLIEKLAGFRHALLRTVARDAFSLVLLVTIACFLIVLVADRFGETPVWARTALLGVIGSAVGYAAQRLWTTAWACRSPLQIAKVIRRRSPFFGDHLVGAIELADSESEQARSAKLCDAALKQVADEVSQKDLLAALPVSRWKIVSSVAWVMIGTLVVVGLLAPSLLGNVATRLMTPLAATPRYTFVDLPVLPGTVVVPLDEASSWSVRLGSQSRWTPGDATLRIGQRRVDAEVAEGSEYRFDVPALVQATDGDLRIGDSFARVRFVPKLRPELTSIAAQVELPEYLAQGSSGGTLAAAVADGVIDVVEGGSVTLDMIASAELSRATVDGRQVPVDGRHFRATIPRGQERIRIDWVDRDALGAARPLAVAVRQVQDQQPTLLVQSDEIPARVLQSESLRFAVLAEDDYAVRRVGMRWTVGGDDASAEERVLGPNEDESTVAAIFQATALSAPSGEVRLRFWAEDDLPGRKRVYSDPILLNVLSSDEHAVWIAEQFAKWRQAAMDVRDRELSLYSRNRELAETDVTDRDQRWSAAVALQARAEELNGVQLRALAEEGEALLRQAARNSEVEADSIETLAQTIETLEQLADDRMPRVADLLKQASEDEEEESKFAEMTDQESSQGRLPDGSAGDGAEGEESRGEDDPSERIGLAGTTIIDTSKRSKTEEVADPQDALSIAVDDQADLVAEFDAVAEQLRELLGNMEGSTLVKRLKSVSRLQDRVAMRLSTDIEKTFGEPKESNDAILQAVETDVADSAARVRTVLDDLDAFCERREIEHFAAVLDEMKTARVLERLTELRDRVADRPGVSISAAEYWADNLDRWADDLVDPGSAPSDPGSQSSKSLSPAVMLEVLRILESEVNLREQTRVAEQGRQVMERDDYMSEAIRLSETQDRVRDRLDVVISGIDALPDAMMNFGGELEVLRLASSAMVDATKTLVSPETGPVAVAAQTEAIELLLRSKKIGAEGGGGGGGADGGAGGETDQAAIALLGRGLNPSGTQRESKTELAVGGATAEVPEQWRAGLEEYFDRLERRRSGRNDRGTP